MFYRARIPLCARENWKIFEHKMRPIAQEEVKCAERCVLNGRNKAKGEQIAIEREKVARKRRQDMQTEN